LTGHWSVAGEPVDGGGALVLPALRDEADLDKGTTGNLTMVSHTKIFQIFECESY
jgi:hypothetical protein